MFVGCNRNRQGLEEMFEEAAVMILFPVPLWRDSARGVLPRLSTLSYVISC